MTYICAPIFVTLPTDNGVTVEFSPSLAPVVPIPGGPKGLDGVSPIITVTDILGGHKVTITDKDGTETFDVMDGGISEEDFLKVFPQDIASGAVASFPDGADGVPVVDLTVDITPVQSGSGDPSPSNVRPISGWSVANVHISPTLDPQDGTTLTFDLDGVRYGGRLDALTGVLTVDRFYVQLTEATHDWGVATTGGVQSVGYYLYIHYSSEHMSWPTFTNPAALLCDTLPRRMVIPGYNNPYGICLNQNYVAYRLTLEQLGIESTATSAERAEAARTWLANNPTHICYVMAEPQTIQLTAQEVETLLGTNNIWADTGNTTVKYRADTGLYVQKLTGSTEEDMTANTSIASGKYFMVGNTLYFSTTSIPAGDTIKPGTNCTLTNLAAALNALNS